MEHRTRSTERDLEWIDELIATEDQSPDGGGPTSAPSAPNRKEQPHERCPSEDPCRHRRSRQLRQQPAPGRRVLPRRRPRRVACRGSCTSSSAATTCGDVEFVAAFDVDAAKVGLDLGKAIFAGQNNTIRFADGPRDGRARAACARRSTASASTTARPSRRARPSRSTSPRCCATRRPTCSSRYLPVGSEDAQKHYAQCCLDTGVAFVNAIPVFIASDPVWAKKFTDAGVPIVGDDIKSQVGATIVHRILARLFEDRGMVLDRTYQLNVGGNMDFKNMLERERLESKKISKTQSVTSQIDHGIEADDVHIGPSDHVPWLQDRKWAYIRLEGRNFGDVPLNLELKLEVWDSPNSAGVIIDALRCAKLALDRGIGGPLEGPSAYFMKSPLVQHHDDEAHRMVEEFAAGT